MIDPRNPLGASPTEGVSLYHQQVTTIELPATRGSDGRLSSPINVRAVLVDVDGTDFESLMSARFEIWQKPLFTINPPPINKAWDINVMQGALMQSRIVTFTGNPTNFLRWDQLIDVDASTLKPVPADQALASWVAVKNELFEAIDLPDLRLIFENGLI